MVVLTRCQLIGVTRGLEYLHDIGIVHGNLKSVSGGSFCLSTLPLNSHDPSPQRNILIDEAGIPRLHGFWNSSSCPVRYCAPERLEFGGKGRATCESDVYSLSMVIVEVCRFQGMYFYLNHIFLF